MLKTLLRFLAVATFAAVALPVAPASAFEWLGQYGVGSATAGNGGLIAPTDVDIGPGGQVVIADIGIDRVASFDAGGKFLWAIGKDVSARGGDGPEICVDDCRGAAEGAAGGEFSAPWSVATAAEEFYVSDLGNARINVFDYQGRFLRAFGKDVGGPGQNVCTSSCQRGGEGPDGGEMAGPAGIGLDSAGNLFVSELGTHRVDVFDPRSGAFLRAFGKDVGGPGVNACTLGCQEGTADESPGSLNSDFALTLGRSGEVVVGDLQNQTVSIFTNAGQHIRTFGSPGDGPGQLRSPYGLAVSPDGGTLWVADMSNNRLAEYGIGGDFRRALGLDVVPGAPAIPEFCTTSCKEGIWGAALGELGNPEALAVDGRGDVYVGAYGRIDRWGEPPAAGGGGGESGGGGEVSSAGIGATPAPPVRLTPANSLRFTNRQLDRRRGTATITVLVAGRGRVVANAGAKMRVRVTQPRAAGTVKVRLVARRKGIAILRRSGRLWAALRVTFTPQGGTPYTRTKAVRLLYEP